MITHAKSVAQDFARAAAETGSFLRRNISIGTRVDVARSARITSGRTLWRCFVALVIAVVLYNVSKLAPSVIVIWLASLIAMEAAFHLLRAKASRNISLMVVQHFAVYGSWAVMPLLLEFRSPPEAIIGLILLTVILASASMTATQIPLALIGLAPIAVAILAPEIADQLGPRPHSIALGILILKLLFLLNFVSLIWSWYVGTQEEVLLRKALDQSRRKAEALASAKTLFLAHMSDEIRSPLSGVTLMANFLGRLDDIPESERQIIEQIDEGGQAILSLLNTVLDYSKIEAREVGLCETAVDIRALLQNIVNLHKLRAQETDTRLSISVDSFLPSMLMLDENRLRQILTNLISNAVKFSPGASVHVFIGYEDGENGLLVEVIDTGQGVNEEMRSRLFKPYEQDRAATVGTGLGLAICYGLIDLMRGRIGYRNTPNGGATFWVRIPARPPTQITFPDGGAVLATQTV